MKMKPIGEKIIVKPVVQEQVSAGGIVIPDTAKEKPQQGEVIAVGSGRVLDNGQKVAPEVKPGDKVLYSKYAGTEYKDGTDEYLILTERDIHAILL
jgi:chaperonin GroES